MTETAPSPPGPQPDGSTSLDRFVEPLRKGLRRLGIVLLFVMIAMPALQVFLREVLGTPFVGAEELARFMLICVVFVTLPYVVCSGGSIRMEELLSALPSGMQRVLRPLGAALCALVFGIAAFSVAVATLRNLDNATPTLGIPYWVFFSAAFLGLAAAAAESALQFVKALAGRPLYVSFAEEQPPEDPNLDQALSGNTQAERSA